ncbi:hypothetical protein [Kribbella karoonensis]|uniref:Uncharacterized protein n=1 Tax=Kribbella karoonensis TaxID=324851 RepID=A0ABP4NZB3_9ACTN
MKTVTLDTPASRPTSVTVTEVTSATGIDLTGTILAAALVTYGIVRSRRG